MILASRGRARFSIHAAAWQLSRYKGRGGGPPAPARNHGLGRTVARLVAVEDIGRSSESTLSHSLSQDRERRGVLRQARKRSQVRDKQRHIVERRLLVLFEPEAEPAGGEAAVAVRLLPRDQRRHLERLDEADVADLFGLRLRDQHVVALERSLEEARAALSEVVDGSLIWAGGHLRLEGSLRLAAPAADAAASGGRGRQAG